VKRRGWVPLLVLSVLLALCAAWIARDVLEELRPDPELELRPRRLVLDAEKVPVPGKAVYSIRWLEDRLDYGIVAQLVEVEGEELRDRVVRWLEAR